MPIYGIFGLVKAGMRIREGLRGGIVQPGHKAVMQGYWALTPYSGASSTLNATD